MLPAQQCLKTDKPAVRAQLRLVMHDQFAGSAGPQLMLQRAAFAQAHVRRTVEEAHGSATVGFRAMQCGVGIGHQDGSLVAIAWEHSYADACAYLDPLSGDVDLAANGFAQARSQGLRAGRLRAIGNQRELVTSAAR